MNPSEKMFGRDHLLRAWLQNRSSRNAHNDLKNYYGQVAMAFATAFKVDLDHAPQSNRAEQGYAFGERSDEEDLHRFFMDVIAARQSCSSPFSSYREAPKAICDLYQTFGSRLDEALGKFVAVHDELLLELIEKIWGISEMDMVSQSDLDQCGYPTESEPDPFDYW